MTPPMPHQPTATSVARAIGLHQPSGEQQEVIEAPLAPQLVVAGAGSGKTETMSARVTYLVATGAVRPEEVLGLTFTRKAAGELAERLRQRLGQLRGAGLTADQHDVLLASQPTIATYNAFASDLAREHALRVGADPQARLITEAGAWQLADEIVQGWQPALDVDASPAAVTEAVLSLAAALSEHMLTVGEARDGMRDLVAELSNKHAAPRLPDPASEVQEIITSLHDRIALLDLVGAYQRAKHDRGLIEFGDQVALAARIAQEVPAVGAMLRQQYRLVLLDEYQDTSVAQLRLLAALFGTGHAVTAVGDPNQAIYGWRGAAASALGDFPRDFPSDGRYGQHQTPTRYLRTSWRNDSGLLKVANVVSAPLRHESANGDSSVPELIARRDAGDGQIHVAYPPTMEEEATVVADFFAARWHPELRGAVLCRTRRQLAPIVTALQEREVPHQVVGLGGLLTTPEVVDVRSALIAAHDAGRGDALMRLLTDQQLGASDLHALSEWSRALATAGQSPQQPAGEALLAEAVDEPPPEEWCSPQGHRFTAAARERVQGLGALLRELRSMTYLSLPEQVSGAIRVMGLDIELAARAGAEPARSRANLDALIDVAANFAADATTPTLGAFLSWLDAAEQRERGLEPVEPEVVPGAVQLLTIHAAKGLEWDVVAVPGMVESQFPSYVGKPNETGDVPASGWLKNRRELPYPLRGDAASLPGLHLAGTTNHADVRDARDEFREAYGSHRVAEERRLAYVALTRARHTLLMSGSWFRSGKYPCAPSRFLDHPKQQGLVTEVPGTWANRPEDGAENPSLTVATEVQWPIDPLGPRRQRMTQAAATVRHAIAREPHDLPRAEPEPGSRAAAWWADAHLLLQERAEQRNATTDVDLGAHLSASAAVELSADPHAFALQRRRPVPQPPSEHAELGTTFHAWVEEFYGRPGLLDLDEATGREYRDDATEPGGASLAHLQDTFRHSPWASRMPVAVEVDLETAVAGTVLRCRIDAVFEDEDGVQVVDWKTGAPPRTEGLLAEREIQLALYRLAWSRHTGRPLEHIEALFYYVSHDETRRAGDLTEAEVEERLAQAIARGSQIHG